MSTAKNNNALKHGAFSEAVLLPAENIEEFNELHRSLIEEWNPEGPSQHDKVISIAKNMWRKRRFSRYLQRKIAEDHMAEQLREGDRKAYDDELLAMLEEIASDATESITEDKIAEKLPGYWESMQKLMPRKKYESHSAWLSALAESIYNYLERSQDKKNRTVTIDVSLADEAFSGRELAFEERLDAKIDKDIKQLAQMKTLQAMGLGRRQASTTNNLVKQIDALAETSAPAIVGPASTPDLLPVPKS